MAIDQTLIPNDLRPLNLARNVVEENRGPPSTGFIPNSVVREVGSPRSRQVIYPVTVLDSGGNPTTGWYPYQQPMPVSSGGIGEIPNYRIGGNASDHGGDESLDDSGTVKKVKLMCSFGGKILPRPNDGLLRYVGGQTRIISVRRDISFQELVHKMIDTFGRPVVVKYQLPNEDLDALVSVSCPEDLENMMEEYEKLVEEGSRKLRMFLFSASELDASGLVQFSDVLDSGQKYIDAINGVGVGITRKESIASATSTHSDSQLSWGEAIESFAPSQGDGGGIMSPCMSSPRVVVAASHDAPTSLAYVHPNLVTHAEPIPVPMSHPAMVTVNSQNLASLRPEARMERSIPAILPQQQQPSGYNLQQPFGMDFRPPATYMQAYVDPRQHTPPPFGYVNPQLVGVPGFIYTVVNTQQRLQENAVGIPPQQFVPAVHMTMAPSALHASMNSNSTQHFVQPHQSQVNPYPGESLYGARVVQLPVEQSHGAYQPQATASLQKEGYPLQTGGYGWCQAPPVQTVTAPDGWVTHQAGSPPENIRQLEDCHMCQKALPHAHSDTLPQNHRDSMSAFPDKNHVFHGYPIDNQLGTQPPSSTVVSGATGERTAEQQDSGNQPRAGGYTDHDINTNHFRVVGVTQDPELQHGKESLLQMQDNLNQQGFFSHSVVENPGDVKTYGIFSGNVPQSYREDALQQPSMPLPYQVKQEVAMHQPVGTNFLPVNIIPSFQSSESMVQDSSTQHMDKHPGLVPNNDISDSYILYNHVRPIDGRTEIHASTSEISGSNEQCTSPVKRLIKEDISVGKPQIKGQDMLPSNAFTMSGVYPDGNDTKPIETQPRSSSETSYYHNFQPVDSKQITQADMLGSSGPYPNIGVQHTTSDHKWHDAPPFTGVDSVDATDRYNRIGEWQAEALLFQSRMLPNDTMADPSSGISSSPSVGMVQDNWGAAPSNSLFSNKDPWTLHHDSCIPKTSNLPCREEVVSTTEEGVLQKPEGDLNKDSNVEHVRSDKEEHIRKELEAVAEGVAALVLQSSITSDSVPDMTELMLEAGVEDVKTKIPISDGIGHLQIIKNNDLEELRELGSGTFGIVYHGKWRGSDVAIKRINDRCFAGKPSEKVRMLDDFWNEAIKLADLHHPNVVAFYGVVLDGPGGSVATVTEYMVDGSLRQALQRNDRALDKRKRLLVAMDVAFGMEYLHEKNIVHFDLKSDNLLINLRDTLRPICKVGDLGLSKVKCQTLISGGVRGTLPWMAPELLNGSSSLVSEKVDVFSFGIVMWELLTGEEPYADLHYGAIIGGIVNNTLRPSVPVSCSSEWRSLMESCWSAEPSERPSFTQIANMLRSMAASLPQKGQNQQQQQMQK